MDMEHPNIVSTYINLEAAPSTLKRVLVIETDLAVDSRDPIYDRIKVDELIELSSAFLRQNDAIADSVRIVPRQ